MKQATIQITFEEEKLRALRRGAMMPAHAGESGWEIPIPAEKLLQQELVSVRKAENGQWYAITTDPQPDMANSEQIQEMQL